MHALLTPGTHLLRRPGGTAQVGLDAGHAVRLDGISEGHPGEPWDPAARDAWRTLPGPVLARLAAAGLAAGDDRSLREALPARDRAAVTAWRRHTLAALFRTDPPAMADAMDARCRTEVTVTTYGHPLGGRMVADLEDLCRRSALPLAAERAPGPPRKDAPPTFPLRVVVGVGEPRREILDPLVRDGEPHLLVRMVEGVAVVGPFVVPGTTPCLRCLDAHHAAVDPAWPLLVEQYARAVADDRPDGVPEPVDAALAALALAWAARDLATYAGGGRPATWGTTVRIAPALEALETRHWPLHPACGCGWV